MTTEDISGLEFDWFAADKFGHIARFSSAGFGMVPTLSLQYSSRQDEILKILHAISGLDPDEDPLCSPRGFPYYVFDWEIKPGPYLLKRRPSGLAASVAMIPDRLRQAIVEVAVDFSEITEIEIKN